MKKIIDGYPGASESLPDDRYSDSMKGLLDMMFKYDPRERPSAAAIMRDPYLRMAQAEARSTLEALGCANIALAGVALQEG